MALVQLSNVILPEVYIDLAPVNNPEKTALVDSGVIARSPLFDSIVNNEASERPNLPFWNDIDPDLEANYSDDSETEATPNNITQGKMTGRVCYLNQAFKEADLVQQRIKDDPMQQIRNRFGTYWQRQFQRRVSNTLIGVMGNNIANDDGDMVNDIHGATNADVNANTLFSQDAFINAAFTMGDMFDAMSVVYMHSIVYARLLKQNDVVDVRNSDGALLYSTYMNHRIIIDDNVALVTPAAGASGSDAAAKYVTVILGASAIAYGQGYPKVPVEVYRQPLQGKGGGAESIIERVNMLIHPYGHQWNEVSIAGRSPTLAELAEAQQYTRVIPRKNIPLAFLVTNG